MLAILVCKLSLCHITDLELPSFTSTEKSRDTDRLKSSHCASLHTFNDGVPPKVNSIPSDASFNFYPPRAVIAEEVGSQKVPKYCRVSTNRRILQLELHLPGLRSKQKKSHTNAPNLTWPMRFLSCRVLRDIQKQSCLGGNPQERGIHRKESDLVTSNVINATQQTWYLASPIQQPHNGELWYRITETRVQISVCLHLPCGTNSQVHTGEALQRSGSRDSIFSSSGDSTESGGNQPTRSQYYYWDSGNLVHLIEVSTSRILTCNGKLILYLVLAGTDKRVPVLNAAQLIALEATSVDREGSDRPRIEIMREMDRLMRCGESSLGEPLKRTRVCPANLSEENALHSPYYQVTIDRAPAQSLGLTLVERPILLSGNQCEDQSFTGIFIKHMALGGLADQTGRIQVGDQLLSINSVSVLTTPRMSQKGAQPKGPINPIDSQPTVNDLEALEALTATTTPGDCTANDDRREELSMARSVESLSKSVTITYTAYPFAMRLLQQAMGPVCLSMRRMVPARNYVYPCETGRADLERDRMDNMDMTIQDTMKLSIAEIDQSQIEDTIIYQDDPPLDNPFDDYIPPPVRPLQRDDTQDVEVEDGLVVPIEMEVCEDMINHPSESIDAEEEDMKSQVMPTNEFPDAVLFIEREIQVLQEENRDVPTESLLPEPSTTAPTMEDIVVDTSQFVPKVHPPGARMEAFQSTVDALPTEVINKELKPTASKDSFRPSVAQTEKKMTDFFQWVNNPQNRSSQCDIKCDQRMIHRLRDQQHCTTKRRSTACKLKQRPQGMQEIATLKAKTPAHAVRKNPTHGCSKAECHAKQTVRNKRASSTGPLQMSPYLEQHRHFVKSKPGGVGSSGKLPHHRTSIQPKPGRGKKCKEARATTAQEASIHRSTTPSLKLSTRLTALEACFSQQLAGQPLESPHPSPSLMIALPVATTAVRGMTESPTDSNDVDAFHEILENLTEEEWQVLLRVVMQPEDLVMDVESLSTIKRVGFSGMQNDNPQTTMEAIPVQCGSKKMEKNSLPVKLEKPTTRIEQTPVGGRRAGNVTVSHVNTSLYAGDVRTRNCLIPTGDK